MATLPERKLEEVKDPTRIRARLFDPSQYAYFENTCAVDVYITIQWPNDAITNFHLRPSETHSVFIGSGGNPCGCYSTLGVVPDCGDKCGTIEGGHLYKTCS